MTDPEASRLSTWGRIAPFGERCRRWVDVPDGGNELWSTDRPGRREYILAKSVVRDGDGDGGREDRRVSR